LATAFCVFAVHKRYAARLYRAHLCIFRVHDFWRKQHKTNGVDAQFAAVFARCAAVQVRFEKPFDFAQPPAEHQKNAFLNTR